MNPSVFTIVLLFCWTVVRASKWDIIRSQLPQGKVTPSRTIKCASCMSAFYEHNWRILRRIYVTPKKFTNHCNNDFNAATHYLSPLPTVDCNSTCVSVFERAHVGGLYVPGYIRGCADSVLRDGFNQSITKAENWTHNPEPKCLTYIRRDLFKLNKHNISNNEKIHLCRCRAPRCNDFSWGAAVNLEISPNYGVRHSTSLSVYLLFLCTFQALVGTRRRASILTLTVNLCCFFVVAFG